MINACISHVIITLIRYFLIPKSRDLVSHNPGISGLKNGPGSRDPGIRDPGIAIPNRTPSCTEVRGILYRKILDITSKSVHLAGKSSHFIFIRQMQYGIISREGGFAALFIGLRKCHE